MPAALWPWLRRASQTAFFALALFLVVETTYPVVHYSVFNVIPELSPLLGLTAIISARAFYEGALWAVLVVALTLVLGRAFCGWACPVGATLDAGDWLVAKLRRKKWREPAAPHHRRYRILFLVALLICAAFGLPLAGWFDPLSLFPRTLAVAAVPYATFALDGATRLLYHVPAAAGLAAAIRQRVIPENLALVPGHFLVAGFFVALLALGLVQRRFYCRYVCPTGALLAVIGWASPFGRRVAPGDCTDCARCRNVCRMGAITGTGEGTATAECNLCMDCLPSCRPGAVSFGFGRKRPTENPTTWAPALTRRGFLITSGAGLAAAAPLAFWDDRAGRDPFLVRPPGALPETDFQARCVRCGECMRICLTQGLVPVHFEAGPTGLWTPRLLSRKGYCEYRCTMCTRICPTGALKPLTEEEKKKAVIGIAAIWRRSCIPWLDEEDCNVCEEMCPTAPKAIVLRGPGRLKPYVVPDRCVGCGICEYACPVEGASAIRVFNDALRPEITARGAAFGRGGAGAGGGRRYRGRAGARGSQGYGR